MATIKDLEFAAMWLKSYEYGDDEETKATVERAVAFLDKEINKRKNKKGNAMNWQLDPNDPYVWQIEGSPFGVEKIDRGVYVPFRLWNKARVSVGIYSDSGRKTLTFSTRQEAMKYTEEAFKEYKSRIIASA